MIRSLDSATARHPAADRFAITVAFEVKPECRGMFLALVRANAAASLGAESKCLRFDVLVPVALGQPDVLLYEVYTDRPAFDAHLSSPHFLEFDTATRDMVLRKTIMEFLVEGPRPA
jgi:autoinducer 2-degrading protein